MGDTSFKAVMDGDIAVLSVSGALDAHNAPELDKNLKTLLGKTKKIVLDMAHVAIISTPSLGVLSDTRGQGGRIVIAGPVDSVKKVFDTMGFSKVFKIVPDVQQAKKSF